MGRRASADPSTSGHGTTPVRRRRRRHLFRHRSPTPSSIDDEDETSQELMSPPSHTHTRTAASFPDLEQQQQPPSSSRPAAVPAADDYNYNNYDDDDEGDVTLNATANVLGSYVAVAPLPIFRGDAGECPDAHLAHFDRVRRANGASTPSAAALIFPASLAADAALWYDLRISSSSDSPDPPWDAVRAAFLDFFRPPCAADLARADLAALRQRPGEAVGRYHLRLQGLLRWCSAVSGGIGGGDVPDDGGAVARAAFVDGLLAEFRDWVAPQRPAALDDAVALALSWERAAAVREAWRAARAACSSSSAVVAVPAAAVVAVPAVVTCSFCGEDGHEEERCEARRRSGGGGGGGGVVAAEEDGGGGGGRSGEMARLESTVSTRSAQCQCRRHQCGKKAVAVAPVSDVVAGDGDAAAEKSNNQLAGLVNLMRSLRS